MWIYWVMFLWPALACLSGSAGKYKPQAGSWLLLFLGYVLAIGLRHDVGGDWGNYVRIFRTVSKLDFEDVLEMGDPGYHLLAWWLSSMGADYHILNLVCAVICCSGVFIFARTTPRPWLAVTVAVPYLLVVVGMGYVRQSVALGLAMMGLVALTRKSNFGFVVLVLLGATFHKSAVLLVPLAILATPKNKLWTAIWAGVAGAVGYVVLLGESTEKLVSTYVNSDIQSEGAMVRVAMNLVPALFFLRWRDKLKLPKAESNLWLIMAIITLAAVPALFLFKASTAVDRLMLYMLPLQLFVAAHVPDMMASSNSGKRTWIGYMVAMYGLVFIVWFNFATHAGLWEEYDIWWPE
jgi:hypothetical protein